MRNRRDTVSGKSAMGVFRRGCRGTVSYILKVKIEFILSVLSHNNTSQVDVQNTYVFVNMYGNVLSDQQIITNKEFLSPLK
jgi:hypothetical protein